MNALKLWTGLTLVCVYGLVVVLAGAAAEIAAVIAREVGRATQWAPR